MFKCNHCGIKINSDSEPVNCPGCGNGTGFSEVGNTNVTTGICPDCMSGACAHSGNWQPLPNRSTSQGGRAEIVDRYTGQPVIVDSDNVLVNDPETGFNESEHAPGAE